MLREKYQVTKCLIFISNTLIKTFIKNFLKYVLTNLVSYDKLTNGVRDN